jgi:thiol-disulfide isomerase/thioredoxin
VVGGIALAVWVYTSPGKYDEFAKCLTDNGAKFYGAFWCPHCQAQKKMSS